VASSLIALQLTGLNLQVSTVKIKQSPRNWQAH